ncbi:hypothetical protein Mx9_p69 [Myxococcus phage Mx9]|nr:hypothetical protein Mx9_p69 [Myxococcus phage Mx9]
MEGCLRPARRSGLCWGHLKRRQRGPQGTELRERGLAPKARFLEAVYDLVEVDASDKRQWELAWKRLRMAAYRYVRADKATDPRRKKRTPE